MIAVARVTAEHDERGREVLPLIHLCGKKTRRTDIRVNVDLASQLCPLGFKNGPCIEVHGGHFSGADSAAWPYSVGILCRFTAFLGTLHWPVDTVDMGHFGVSYPEVLILFEQWAGHRLLSEKVTGPHARAGRPFSFSSTLLKRRRI